MLLPDKEKGVIVIILDYGTSNSGDSVDVSECHLKCIHLTFGMVIGSFPQHLPRSQLSA